MPQPIAMAKIEEMFSAYADTPSASHVSRVCGVDKRTAQKYIAEGDPVRGIEPFVQRVKRITRLAARRVEKKIAYKKADAHAAAWEHLQLMDDCITEALLDIRENMAERNPKSQIVVVALSGMIAVLFQGALTMGERIWVKDDVYAGIKTPEHVRLKREELAQFIHHYSEEQ